jgi:DNA modification methylase
VTTQRVIVADCRPVMADMAPNSIDAVVTDPPYGLEFMGKEWDRIGNRAHPLAPRKEIGPAREYVVGDKWSSLGGGYGAPEKNRRCRICGGYGFSATKRCDCAEPDWDARTGEYGRLMQDWHGSWLVEVRRVLKPGAPLLCFGGTRTWHRLACAVEDAGFVIVDTLMWLHGQGFPTR